MGNDHADENDKEKLTFQDKGTGPGNHWNNWEACYKYRKDATSPYKWYAAGTSGLPAFNSVQTVLDAITSKTQWYYYVSDPLPPESPVYGVCGDPGPNPERIW